jgi:hypothetical protein
MANGNDGGTPNYVEIPADLKAKLSEFQGISDTILALAEKVDHINALNKTAAGKDDATAKAYHAQINGPTNDMATLVQEMGHMFGVKAEAGSDAADVLNASGDKATEAASAVESSPS